MPGTEENTYDLTTSVGLVRLIIGDTVLSANKMIFRDAEITGFLSLYSDDIRLAAAAALDTIASTEALLRKKIGTADFDIDSPAVAMAIRAHAKQLRTEAAEIVTGAENPGFDYADVIYNVFSDREVRFKQAQRVG